jgi:predicted RNA-binding Zn-ribbon protein involved in translation (DUF1610 family)
MKTYLSLIAVALGLFFGLSVANAALDCPQCKSSIPASTKPVVEMAKSDMKCSVCQMNIKGNTSVTKMVCPACKAEMSLCAMCAKGHGEAAASDAMGKTQKVM